MQGPQHHNSFQVSQHCQNWSSQSERSHPNGEEIGSGACMRYLVAMGRSIAIGETKRTLETRMKEHHAAARLEQLEKSAVAEHAWLDGHTIDWSDVRILDEVPKELCTADQRSPAHQLEARPTEDRINRDLG